MLMLVLARVFDKSQHDYFCVCDDYPPRSNPTT